MPDREKVIKGLEICSTAHRDGSYHCGDCPYESDEDNVCGEKLCADALALLKEQENEKKRNPVIVCPHCGKRVK